MRVCIITDGEHATDLSRELQKSLTERFITNGSEVLHYGIAKDDVNHCIGCFGCWIKKPGECVITDLIGEVNRDCMNSDLVIYISPILFGGFSGVIKNVLDRSLPTISPFFTVTDDQTTHHPRYDKYPRKAIIGYGDSITDKEKNTFCQWITSHGIGEKVYVCSSVKDQNKILSDLEYIEISRR